MECKELAAFMTNMRLLANYIFMCKKIPRKIIDMVKTDHYQTLRKW